MADALLCRVNGDAVAAGRRLGRDEFTTATFPRAEVQKLPENRLREITRDMIKIIFDDIGMDVEEHSECFEATVQRIIASGFWKEKTLSRWGGYKAIRREVVVCNGHWQQEQRTCVIPAPSLLVFWAAVNMRHSESNRRDEASQYIRHLQMYKHLNVAIEIYAKHKKKFFVEIRETAARPVVTNRLIHGLPVVECRMGFGNRMGIDLAQMDYGLLLGEDEEVPPEPKFEVSEEEMEEYSPREREILEERLSNGPMEVMSEDHFGEPARMVVTYVQITREEVMNAAGDLFDTLRRPISWAGQNIRPQVEEWINDTNIKLLDEGDRNYLYLFCLQNQMDEWTEKL
ncbi:hypothetical protein BGZ63DRAFT_408164 [Mariannaea sp. PMI_226]|nr:hypothetical protein BGZ63DRAFT_408164 [Mariannaea sp. PMI_226]